MTIENKTVKQDLLRLFEEGKNTTEAFEEISKKHSSCSISLKTVGNWFEKFNAGEYDISDKKRYSRGLKITDEFLINLVNDNPELDMAELAKLANVSQSTIYRRLKIINIDGKGSNYINKGCKNGVTKFSDEFLINLVNENPDMNMKELAKHAGTTYRTISYRLKQINSSEKRAGYIKKDFKNNTKKVSDEYLISLVKDNPELNMKELAKLADISQSAISVKLKKINRNRPNDSIVIQEKNVSKVERKKHKTITDEYFIKLVNENPELNAQELANIAGVSQATIYNMLKNINACGQKVNYTKKGKRGGVKSFTDEFLIDLVNENPDLNISELAELCNTSRTTLSRRLKQIDNDGKGTNYIRKDFKNTVKLTDEFLINLVNENPDLNISELAELSNTTSATISKRLRKINCNGERVKYLYRK